MEIANIILEYVKVLINWPVVVLTLALIFRAPLSEFLRRLRKVGFPGGSLDAEADEASSEVDQVAPATAGSVDSSDREPAEIGEKGEKDQTPTESPEPGSGEDSDVGQPEPLQVGNDDADYRREGYPQASPEARLEREMKEWRHSVDEGQHYESYRQLALTSPEEAAREAYQRVRLMARRTLLEVIPSGRNYVPRTLSAIVADLSVQELISPDAVEPAGRLDRISRSADGDSLSAKGALSFIDAAQKLDFLLREARRIALHKRRVRMRKAAPLVEQLLSKHGMHPPTVVTSVGSASIQIRFANRAPNPESDRAYDALLVELAEFAKNKEVPIRIRHLGDSDHQSTFLRW